MGEHNVQVSASGAETRQESGAVPAPRQVSLCNANFSGSD